jgi:hypothetical protein
MALVLSPDVTVVSVFLIFFSFPHLAPFIFQCLNFVRSFQHWMGTWYVGWLSLTESWKGWLRIWYKMVAQWIWCKIAAQWIRCKISAQWIWCKIAAQWMWCKAVAHWMWRKTLVHWIWYMKSMWMNSSLCWGTVFNLNSIQGQIAIDTSKSTNKQI